MKAKMAEESSMAGLQDGEGPSNRNPKRARRDSQTQTNFREQIPEEGPNNVDNGGNVALVGAFRNESFSFTLTDPKVLDCSICYQPLVAPVFQCGNGHLCCSFCHIKIENTCPSCNSPIVDNRNRAIERVLESVKLICQNVKYGCNETMSYSKKDEHEKECHYTPCPCPFRDCNFIGSYSQFQQHFGGKHENFVVPFLYGQFVEITLNVGKRVIVLQEEKDGDLFILSNATTGSRLNQIWVSHFAPSWEGFSFHTTLARCSNSTLILQSFTKSIHAQKVDDHRLVETNQNQVDMNPSLESLLVPSEAFGCNGQLIMDICIARPTVTQY